MMKAILCMGLSIGILYKSYKNIKSHNAARAKNHENSMRILELTRSNDTPLDPEFLEKLKSSWDAIPDGRKGDDPT